MREWLEETLALHSNRTPEQVNKDIDRDKILGADEAVEYGLIDQVLTSRKNLPALRQVARTHDEKGRPRIGAALRRVLRLLASSRRPSTRSVTSAATSTATIAPPIHSTSPSGTLRARFGGDCRGRWIAVSGRGRHRRRTSARGSGLSDGRHVPAAGAHVN